MAKTIQALYKEYHRGTPINNVNMVRLHRHMRDTADKLSILGATFRLAFTESFNVSRQTRQYLDARDKLFMIDEADEKDSKHGR